MDSKVLWIESLGAADALLLRARVLFTGERLRYDENKATPLGVRIAGAAAEPARLTLARRDADGGALNYSCLRLLQDGVDDFLRERLPGRRAAAKSAFMAYFTEKLASRVTFLVMARAAAAAEPGSRHRYYIPSQPADRLLHASLKDGLVRSPLPTGWFKTWAVPLRLLARGLAGRLLRPEIAHSLTGKPGVWVEFSHDQIDGFCSQVFWRERVDRTRWDIVFYMDRPDSPCDARTRERVEAMGLRWLDAARPWTLAGLDPGGALLILLRLLAPGRPWWVAAFDAEFEATALLWENAFRRFGTRLILQHQEKSWRPCAQALAIERAGGAMFGLHWSELPFTKQATHPNPEHVFFVWGATNKRWLEEKGHDCRHVLPGGLWLRSDEARIADMRRRVDGAAFTLALFDSSFAYNIFFSAAMLAEFLEASLDLLERHADWKALLKPKSAGVYGALPGGRALAARLDALAVRGRVAVLDPSVSPIEAALAADLAVCFGFNSAGVVAGARGGRAVHWDCAGWTRHPLYADPDQRILYPDLAGLRAAVEAAAAGDRSIGDFSRWRRLSDHFEDRGAAERIGDWVAEQLAETERLGNGRAAADETARRYIERHGVEATFLGPGIWWRG